jgi:hypothetical protein
MVFQVAKDSPIVMEAGKFAFITYQVMAKPKIGRPPCISKQGKTGGKNKYIFFIDDPFLGCVYIKSGYAGKAIVYRLY